MRRVPGDHRRERQQPDRRRQVRARAPQPGRADGSSTGTARTRPAGRPRGTCSAAPRPRPGRPRARAAAGRGASRAATRRSSVRSQKKTSGPSGRANVPTARPIVGRAFSDDRRQHPGPGAVEPAGQAGHQPRRAGEQRHEPQPQGQRRDRRRPARARPSDSTSAEHRRVVEVAPVAVDGEQVVVRLVVARPQAAGPGQPQHRGAQDQAPECASWCHP